MYAKKLLTIAVAMVVVVGGAAAVGAAVPADTAAGDASSGDDNSTASPGPDDGLPEQVPDHVSDIHETISSFLDGEIDNLGSALSGLLESSDDAGNES